MSKKNKNKKSKKRGFSLLESILSVFLVALGLVAALSLLTAGLSQSLKNRDQFIASLLAQEGVEMARNMRDNFWVDEGTETSSFDFFPGREEGETENLFDNCLISKDISGQIICFSSNSSYLRIYLDEDGYYRNYTNSPVPSDSQKTKYYRKAKFQYLFCDVANTPNCSPKAKKDANLVEVTSMVTWSGKNSFPTNVSECNTQTKCAYTQINLNKWGE